MSVRAMPSFLLLSLSLQAVAMGPSACASGVPDCSSEHAGHNSSVDGEADTEIADITVTLLQHKIETFSPTLVQSDSAVVESHLGAYENESPETISNDAKQELGGGVNYQSIQVDGGICLAASQGGEKGGVVRLANCDPTHKTQKWKYDEGTRELKNAWDLCVHSEGGSNGVEMRSCDGSIWQRWDFSKSGDLATISNFGECLTAFHRNEDLSPVSMRACDISRGDQLWHLVGDYPDRSIQVDGGTCLAASEGDKEGGVVRLATCDSTHKTQKWKYHEGTNELKNAWDLCIHNTVGSNGVEMRSCDGSISQRWDFSNSGGLLPMKNAGKCLTAKNRHEDLAPVSVKTCDGSRRDQMWQFVD